MAYTDNANGFFAVGKLGSNAKPTIMGRGAASQTFARGDMLIPSSGYVQIAVYTSVVLLGLSMKSVTGASATYPWVDFVPALPDMVFVGQCSGTPTIANLYAANDIEGTTGIMEINENATSYNVIRPIELWDKTEGYGLNARLKFIVVLSTWNISA